MANKIQYAKGPYSPFQLLTASNAYFALSEVATAAYPVDQETMSRTVIDSDESLASATNRILAIELYFKALLVGLAFPVPMVHNLVILFEHLPLDVRDELDRQYDARCRKQILPDHAQAIVMGFQLTDAIDSEDMPKVIDQLPLNLSLLQLLEKNKDGFIDSRYLFQRATVEKSNWYVYHYRRLSILAKLLRATLEVSLAAMPSAGSGVTADKATGADA